MALTVSVSASGTGSCAGPIRHSQPLPRLMQQRQRQVMIIFPVDFEKTRT